MNNIFNLPVKKCFLSEKDSEGHIIPGTVPKEAECGLVLGGDGTLIRAVRDLGERSLPLLGINLGTLGYLTDVDLEDFESALDHLFSETPVIEERMMLEGSFRNSRKDMDDERYCHCKRRKGSYRKFSYLCQRGASEYLSRRWSDHIRLQPEVQVIICRREARSLNRQHR